MKVDKSNSAFRDKQKLETLGNRNISLDTSIRQIEQGDVMTFTMEDFLQYKPLQGER